MKFLKWNIKRRHVHAWVVDDSLLKRIHEEIIINRKPFAEVAQFCKCGDNRVIKVGLMYSRIY